jgi:hypothetical protein
MPIEPDISAVVERLSLLLRNGEPRVLENLLNLVAEMPCDTLASFFGDLFKLTYLPVNGGGQHVAELRFVLPGGADELLTALRAYELHKNNFFAHGAIPSSSCASAKSASPSA